MEDTEILEMVSGYADSVSITGMEVCAVAVILFAIGYVVGLAIFDILSMMWHT